MRVHRAEHVGSYLRPKEVLDARNKNQNGQLSDAELRTIEDKNISELIQQELKAGMRSISDGEFRREYFHFDFLKHLGGVELKSEDIAHHTAKDSPTSLKLYVTGKVHHARPIEVDNFRFLQDQIKGIKNAVVKMTIPSPTMCHFRGGREAISKEAYPDLEPFFEDVARAYRGEIAALAAAGCKYLQMDDTNLAYLCDLNMRQAAAGRGEDLNTLPRQYVKLINEALRDKPADMRTAIHLCRGNFKSKHFAEGGYEPIAEVLFNELNVDTYFLEFDDSRSGSFEPLRFLPKGNKTVILGLISTKIPALEKKDDIIKRIHEAAQYADLRQLGLSGQCGFSSTHHGNSISYEDQWKKIALINEIVSECAKVWPDEN